VGNYTAAGRFRGRGAGRAQGAQFRRVGGPPRRGEKSAVFQVNRMETGTNTTLGHTLLEKPTLVVPHHNLAWASLEFPARTDGTQPRARRRRSAEPYAGICFASAVMGRDHSVRFFYRVPASAACRGHGANSDVRATGAVMASRSSIETRNRQYTCGSSATCYHFPTSKSKPP